MLAIFRRLDAGFPKVLLAINQGTAATFIAFHLNRIPVAGLCVYDGVSSRTLVNIFHIEVLPTCILRISLLTGPSDLV